LTGHSISEGQNACDTDEYDIRTGGVPKVSPFLDIHDRRVMFGHIALTDATNVLLPSQLGWVKRRQALWQRNELWLVF